MSIPRVSFAGGLLALALLVAACGAPATQPTSAPTKAPAVPTTAAPAAATKAPAGTAMPAAGTAMPSGTAAPTKAPGAAGTTGGATSGTIALLLPETKTTRYEAADRPYFEQKFKQLCSGCQIIYSNANQDASAQLRQFEAALSNGAKVVVLDPVDSAAAATMADRAKAQGVPIVAYDRLINNSDGVNYYVSFDNEQVGRLQAQSLVDELARLVQLERDGLGFKARQCDGRGAGYLHAHEVRQGDSYPETGVHVAARLQAQFEGTARFVDQNVVDGVVVRRDSYAVRIPSTYVYSQGAVCLDLIESIEGEMPGRQVP